MRISEKGIKLIQQYEGLRLQAYKCAAGVWTIGWGWTGLVDGKSISAGMTITRQKADDLFKQGIVKYENYVNSMKREFNQHEFDALCSFVYNCGLASLQSLCKNRTNSQIADALLLYNKGSGKVLAGLTKRRKAERELFLKPVNNKEENNSNNELPFKVKTLCDLNIRTGAGVNFEKIRTVKKGSILTVWAIVTNEGTKWGKNGKEFFCLKYCEKI